MRIWGESRAEGEIEREKMVEEGEGEGEGSERVLWVGAWGI